MNIEICIRDLTKFREEWLTLPTELKLNTEHEYIIVDYNAPFEISEYTNIEELNQQLQRLEELNLDKEEFAALCKSHSSLDYKEILETIINEDYTIIEVTNTIKLVDGSDIAYQLYEEGFLFHFLKEIPEHLVDLMDWEGIWRECEISYGWNQVYKSKTGRQFAINIK